MQNLSLTRKNGEYILVEKVVIMTAKEKKLELEEIFSFKFMLTNKLNHNVKQLLMIDAAIDDCKDMDEIESLKRLKRTGSRLVYTQKKELSKLSSKRIAKQVSVSYPTVIYQYGQYTSKRL